MTRILKAPSQLRIGADLDEPRVCFVLLVSRGKPNKVCAHRVQFVWSERCQGFGQVCMKPFGYSTPRMQGRPEICIEYEVSLCLSIVWRPCPRGCSGWSSPASYASRASNGTCRNREKGLLRITNLIRDWARYLLDCLNRFNDVSEASYSPVITTSYSPVITTSSSLVSLSLIAVVAPALKVSCSCWLSYKHATNIVICSITNIIIT